MSDAGGSGYGLSQVEDARKMAAPELAYLPRLPEGYRPKIGLIGCGGISEYHLAAYKALGLEVVALCDEAEDRAEARRAAFYPGAVVTADYREVLARDDIEVIDAVTHPEERGKIIEASLRAKKHVLSQKPFVTDLAEGMRLVKLADEMSVKLAVNQNGRWAPHFAYVRRAIEAGLLGEVSTADFSLQWDHTWVASTPFDELRHLILYDFAIHWFDIVTAFFGEREATSVSARIAQRSKQVTKPPMLAHVLIEYPDGQATMSFNAHVKHGQQDATTVCGEHGTIRSVGPSLSEQRVTLYTDAGAASPELQGTWFVNGFQGTMAELLCAIAEGREPETGARGNLRSLALCFAAMASADLGGNPVKPGAVVSAPP